MGGGRVAEIYPRIDIVVEAAGRGVGGLRIDRVVTGIMEAACVLSAGMTGGCAICHTTRPRRTATQDGAVCEGSPLGGGGCCCRCRRRCCRCCYCCCWGRGRWLNYCGCLRVLESKAKNLVVTSTSIHVPAFHPHELSQNVGHTARVRTCHNMMA